MKYFQRSLQAIEKQGALLVFPIANSNEPHSLWSQLFSQDENALEWDDGADNRVAELWHFTRRAGSFSPGRLFEMVPRARTFFSKSVFQTMLALRRPFEPVLAMTEARSVLEILEENSPLSTKALRNWPICREEISNPPTTNAQRTMVPTLDSGSG